MTDGHYVTYEVLPTCRMGYCKHEVVDWDFEPLTLEVWRNARGEVDRPDGPARIFRDAKTGEVKIEEWWKDGLMHREDEPALIVHGINGTLANGYRIWYRGGYKHRKKGPAEVSFDFDQIPDMEAWFEDGYLSRRGGPAYWSRYDDVVYCEYWYRNGLLDRPDGAAVTSRSEHDGKVDFQAFWKRGIEKVAKRRGDCDDVDDDSPLKTGRYIRGPIRRDVSPPPRATPEPSISLP